MQDIDLGNNQQLDEAEAEIFRQFRNNQRKKLLQNLAGVAGNVLEWYDFAVFGYFSDVIGEVFFPPQRGNAAIMESFTVFGLAFLCRPIGGLMMGYIGDTYGRKTALETSIFLMAIPTFAMGCLPTYEEVGTWAIIFLVIVRILQGLSVGGQLVSSLVFTCENNQKSSWGFYGSLVMAAANFGTLLGSMIAYFIRLACSDQDLKNWGWRLPFFCGILVAFSGIYLKFYVDDDVVERLPRGVSDDVDTYPHPFKAAFAKNNRRALLSASMVPALWAGGFYVTFVWMATFMDTLLDPPIDGAFGASTLALFVSVCCMFPVAGAFSDVYGRTPLMYRGAIYLAAMSPLMIYAISDVGEASTAFFALSLMGIGLSLFGGPMCAWLVEGFPAHMRLTSVAVGYNISHSIVGGSSPALATYLVDRYGKHAPGFMVTILAVISLIGLKIAPESDEFNDEESQARGVEITENPQRPPLDPRRGLEHTGRSGREKQEMSPSVRDPSPKNRNERPPLDAKNGRLRDSGMPRGEDVRREPSARDVYRDVIQPPSDNRRALEGSGDATNSVARAGGATSSVARAGGNASVRGDDSYVSYADTDHEEEEEDDDVSFGPSVDTNLNDKIV